MYTPTFNNVLDRMLTLSRVMDDSVADRAWPVTGELRAPMWLPLVDTWQTESGFVVEADLPGVHPENVDISFEKGTLTISGSRAPIFPAKEKKEKGEPRVFAVERPTGRFSRSIRLPEQVDAEKIEANFAAGVLTVTIPMLPSAQPRKIAVHVKESAKEIKG